MIAATIALSVAVKYVAAAYGLVWLAVLLYVWILRTKLVRMERELEDVERRLNPDPAPETAAERPGAVV